MADQQKRGVCGWLLKQLQDGIRGLNIHFIRRINDHNTRRAVGRRHGQKFFKPAGFIDCDYSLKFTFVLLIHGAP
jgi:hypothetical protein